MKENLHRSDARATTHATKCGKLEVNRTPQTETQNKSPGGNAGVNTGPMKLKERSSVGPANLNREQLDQQFLSCKSLLKQIAERVLNGTEEVEEVMQRSYAAAASQRRKFRCEGEFRRWLVRTVLNEALAILHEKESAAAGSSALVFWQVC